MLQIPNTFGAVNALSQFDRGYLSPFFTTDPGRSEAVLENAYILIHEKKISSMKDLLAQIAKSGKAIIAAIRHTHL